MSSPATALFPAQTVLPSLTDEERQRVSDHIKGAEPSYESVILAVQAKK